MHIRKQRWNERITKALLERWPLMHEPSLVGKLVSPKLFIPLFFFLLHHLLCFLIFIAVIFMTLEYRYCLRIYLIVSDIKYRKCYYRIRRRCSFAAVIAKSNHFSSLRLAMICKYVRTLWLLTGSDRICNMLDFWPSDARSHGSLTHLGTSPSMLYQS